MDPGAESAVGKVLKSLRDARILILKSRPGAATRWRAIATFPEKKVTRVHASRNTVLG